MVRSEGNAGQGLLETWRAEEYIRTERLWSGVYMLCLTSPLEAEHRQAFVVIPKAVQKPEAGSSLSFASTLVDSVKEHKNTQKTLKIKCKFTSNVAL